MLSGDLPGEAIPSTSKMFDDGPPPLPPAMPSDSAPDSSFADLADDNRLTAVIDDDSVAEPRLASPDLPIFEPLCTMSALPEPLSSANSSAQQVSGIIGVPSSPSSAGVCDDCSHRSAAVAPENGTAASASERVPSYPGVSQIAASNKAFTEKDVEESAGEMSSMTDTGIEAASDRLANVEVLEPHQSESVCNVQADIPTAPLPSVDADAQSSGAFTKTSSEVQPSIISVEHVEDSEDQHFLGQMKVDATDRSHIGSPKLLREVEDDCSALSFPDLSRKLVEAEVDDSSSVSNAKTLASIGVAENSGNFESHPESGTPGGGETTEQVSALAEQIDDDDDFGDFEEFGGFVESAAFAEAERSDDGWNAFGSATSAVGDKPSVVGETDWTADFSSVPQTAAASTSAEPVPSSAHSSFRQESVESASEFSESLPTLREIFDDSNLWAEESDAGGSADDDEDNRLGECDEFEDVIKSLDSAQSHSQTLRHWETLWLAVSIVEEALALKLQWPQSASYSSFLTSLSMDANLAAARNSNLPAFAQQLDSGTVLRPISFAESAERKADPGFTRSDSTRCISPASPAAPATPEGTAAARPPSRAVPVDSLAVPPVQFDWGNSGLTNPLTFASISASSTLLDLDFLAANESRIVTIAGSCSSSTNISAALQKDLAAFGLSSVDSAKHSDTRDNEWPAKKASILEEIMKKGASERRYTPSCELSLDARALHEQLPDLDYMLANVLLFPMAANR